MANISCDDTNNYDRDQGLYLQAILYLIIK